jgi:hypothetical protein
MEELCNIGLKPCKIVNCPFYDAWNKKLQKINDDKADDAKKNDKTVFRKIGFY